MYLRVGKVTNIYPDTGKVKVMYEDEKSSSLPLPMLTMNNEFSMPSIGDRVVTIHMANGSSKGFVLGTYYGGSRKPKAASGYRKDLGGGVYVTCENGKYTLHASDVTIQADNITLNTSYETVTVEDLIKRIENLEDSIAQLSKTIE